MSEKAESITAKAGTEFFMYIRIRNVANAKNMIADTTGLIVRKKFPMKKPRRMFMIIAHVFAFLPLEKIMNTTAAIQKNARRIATISCL